MGDIMTTKEMSEYLKLHPITICKYAAEGLIPSARVGRVWRFDKDTIDDWIRKGQIEPKTDGKLRKKSASKKPATKKPKK